MNLTSLYRFKILNTVNTPDFLLQPIGKAGNNQVFNELFTAAGLINVKDIGPIPQINDGYKAMKIQFLNTEGKTREMLFQGNVDLLGNKGIVKVKDHRKDSYLYSLIDPETYEVYISEGNARQTQHLLMMLCDGYLNKEVELLHKRIFG